MSVSSVTTPQNKVRASMVGLLVSVTARSRRRRLWTRTCGRVLVHFRGSPEVVDTASRCGQQREHRLTPVAPSISQSTRDSSRELPLQICLTAWTGIYFFRQQSDENVAAPPRYALCENWRAQRNLDVRSGNAGFPVGEGSDVAE